MQLTYNSGIFDVNSIADAMRIILTADDSTTETRWRNETPYVADLIRDHFEIISPNSVLLDYGCGIGRMAKELIVRHGCHVIGVDISPSMRALAPMYLPSDRFFACSSAMLDDLVERGLRLDGALSIYVLQHCQFPSQDIARIRRALRPGGRLFVLNDNIRRVPTLESGWVNDGFDLTSELCREFTLLANGVPAAEYTSRNIAFSSFWATFRRP
jgi:ubiquinone/menaquinone biosynthesis C-methylase UbiE